MWGPQFREMENTGRNLASDQITPTFFDNHHASQKRLWWCWPGVYELTGHALIWGLCCGGGIDRILAASLGCHHLVVE